MRALSKVNPPFLAVAGLAALASIAAIYSYGQLEQVYQRHLLLKNPPVSHLLFSIALDGYAFLLAGAIIFGLLVAFRRAVYQSVTNVLGAVAAAFAASALLIGMLLLALELARAASWLAIFYLFPLMLVIFVPHLAFGLTLLPLSIYYSRRIGGAPVMVGLACIISVALALFSRHVIMTARWS